MKRYEFKLHQLYLNKFFPKFRIKTKVQVIEVLMEATRYMMFNPSVNTEDVVGKIVLYVDKMSRLFFFIKDKYFSISFPFFINELIEEEEQQKYEFTFQHITVDSRLISQVLTIITCDEFKEKCSFDFIVPICEYEEQHNEHFWTFLKELLLMEDGYIRYDYDKENYEKFKKMGKENLHPLNHYDLFYSSNATFKVGLNTTLASDDFIDLLNTNTNCLYLK